MKYKIHALPIWEKGHFRENQEDSIFPYQGMVSDDDRLFMVCDGMGGHESGEIASNAVIEAMSKRILEDSTPEGPFSDELLKQALSDAYDLLDQRDPNPESIKRMGTTMTLLKFHEDGATVAHIGDSRIYQFRLQDDKMMVVFKSVDHSLVNDLVKVGELTPEEALNSPLKNRLTRAMQSHLDSRPKAEIQHIDDIRPGDYFFLCSDGMIENADDENLCFMLGRNVSDEEKVGMLKGNSEDNHDNHSAMLVHILQVDGAPESVPTNIEPAAEKPAEGQVQQPVAPVQGQMKEPVVQPLPPSSPSRWLKVLILILFAACAWLVYQYFSTRPVSDQPQKPKTEEQQGGMEPIKAPDKAPGSKEPGKNKPEKLPTDKPAAPKPAQQASPSAGNEAGHQASQPGGEAAAPTPPTVNSEEHEAEATSDQSSVDNLLNNLQ